MNGTFLFFYWLLTYQRSGMKWILGTGFVKYWNTVSEHCAFAEKSQVIKLFRV